MDIKGVIMVIYASIMGNSAMSGDTFCGDAQKYEVKAISMTWQCDLPMIKRALAFTSLRTQTQGR